MNRLENRIVYKTRKTGEKSFHHFILQEEDNLFFLLFSDEFQSNICLAQEMINVSFQMDKIPDFISLLTKQFYCDSMDNIRSEIRLEDKYLFASIHIDERTFVITRIRYGTSTLDKEEFSFVDLEWPGIQFPWDVSQRIMPESLVWLLDNLKRIYNEWQEAHPDKPRIA